MRVQVRGAGRVVGRGLAEGRDGRAAADLAALRSADLPAAGAVLFIAFVATLGGFGAWGSLIKRYGASTVAPFSMLLPFFGMGSAALFLGEPLYAQDVAGGLLVIGGVLLPFLVKPRPRAGAVAPAPIGSSS
ncbi:drug/metabolite transporter (DMT)-like permease [Catenuloplanes nepalensis]|uniref:Drug/metabolite transporter (DMT)-like permease n=1 Tax=Catenuloplanes nepalensis TaxID=587533 RepID=A0ABT9MKQ6_9ACTN|nr:EamA family transporter [Catenuloplanes nepalensis]MDP9791999.1 drug/metabolite transporter (DMT)-like permease [Catenuloplanes nepalensis]